MKTIRAKAILIAAPLVAAATFGVCQLAHMEAPVWLLILGGGLVGAVAGVVAAAFVVSRAEDIANRFRAWRDKAYERPIDIRTGDELDILQEPISQLHAALQVSRNEVKERQQLMHALSTLSHQLNITLNPNRLLPLVLDEALRHMRARSGMLLLRDEQHGDDLVVRVLRGRRDGWSLGQRIPADSGPIGWVMENHRPLAVRKGMQDRALSLLLPEGVSDDLACIPLLTAHSALGVIYVTDFASDRGFTNADMEVMNFLSTSAAVRIENAILNRQNKEIFLHTVRALASSVDAKDAYTRYHSARVTDFAVAMGRVLRLSPDEMDALQFGGTLHDIGKIAIEDRILNKPGRLSDEEFAIMKTHAAQGSEILKNVPFPWDVLPCVRHHHERYDGKGYPDGIGEEDIEFFARLLAICDSFDAMTSDRVYRKGLPVEVAIDELHRCKGSQFDPDLVPVFLEAWQTEGDAILVKYEDHPYRRRATEKLARATTAAMG